MPYIDYKWQAVWRNDDGGIERAAVVYRRFDSIEVRQDTDELTGEKGEPYSVAVGLSAIDPNEIGPEEARCVYTTARGTRCILYEAAGLISTDDELRALCDGECAIIGGKLALTPAPWAGGA